jgi:drug/metabolite transporter (DMT)-like permease
MIFAGTFLAAGIFEWGFGALNPLGIFYGLLSAVFYTVFLHLSGRVATNLPTVNRTLFTNAGSLIASFCLVPAFFTTGAIFWGFTWVALPLALLGIVAPVLLIQKGAPHLPNGVTTIMASSELPSGVLMGAAFVGDPISFLEILGILIILAGIVVSQLDALRQRQAEDPSSSA